MRFVFKFLNLIDLAAILPTWLQVDSGRSIVYSENLVTKIICIFVEEQVLLFQKSVRKLTHKCVGTCVIFVWFVASNLAAKFTGITRASGPPRRRSLQGYLSYKKTHPPGALR